MLSRQAARNLWLFTLSNAISRFGSQFQFLAITAYTYMVTGSPLATAAQMVISSLPFILLARRAGSVADRLDPRRVYVAVSLLQALLTLGYLLVDGVAAIFALNFLVATATVFLGPARAALMPRMVGKEHLLRANARMQTVSGAIQLLAPALAGSILVRTGAQWAFIFNSISYLAPAAAMLAIRLVETGPAPATDKAHGHFGLTETWAFIRQRRELLLVLATYGAYALGMWAVNAIFYPYTKEILHGDAEIMGWSISAYFGANMITGMALERWGTVLRTPRLLMAGYLCGAVVWVGYALTTSIPVALVLSAFDGIVFTYAVTLFETRIQEEAPEHARGRMFGIIRAYDEICNASGQLMGGALATYGGILPGIRLSAALTGVLVTPALLADLRHRTQPQPQAATDSAQG